MEESRTATDAQALNVLDAAIESGQYDEDSNQGKAANYFALGLDTSHRRALGVGLIDGRYDKIKSIDDLVDMYRYELLNMCSGGDSPMSFYISSNPKDSNEKVVLVYGGALGLPERDWHLDRDSASVAQHEKYFAQVARMVRFSQY